MSKTLEAVDLVKEYPLGSWISQKLKRGRSVLTAVNGVSFSVEPGTTLGIVGESGSGKSVTAQMIMRLAEPTSGKVFYGGDDVQAMSGGALLEYCRSVQIIFQNPYDALNPARTILQSLLEPLQVHGIGTKGSRPQQARARLIEVGLNPPDMYLARYPHELSGGEVQRAAIARSLMLDPDIIVADEPTSMLDVSVRAGVLNLLRSLRKQRNLGMVFISHDFSTIRYICDWTAVMHSGEVVEMGPTAELIERPRHPYTQTLLSAVPVPGDGLQRERVKGFTGHQELSTSDEDLDGET